MSRRDYLKHLCFTTATTILMSKQNNPNTQLPVEVFTRGDYVEPVGDSEPKVKGAVILVTGWSNTEYCFRGVVVEAPIDGPFPLRLGEYSETWHTKKFKKAAYATKLKVLDYDNNQLKGELEGYKKACEELQRQNEKMKAMATGWRPLLEKVIQRHEGGLLPDRILYLEIKKFLYGE
jgi:hypothetical protein